MSQCGKNWGIKVPGYLLIFTLFMALTCFSNRAFSQDSTSTKGRHKRERPKHPSFKQMIDKVNIFKKHKQGDTTARETTKQPEPTPPPPPPPKPQPKTDSVKPKATVKHTGTKKKTKKSTKATPPAPKAPAAKPKTEKQATPII